MLTLARALQALDDVWNAKPADIALTWNTPVQYDPSLVPQLTADYAALNARFDALIGEISTDREAAARRVLACADELHKLRHAEALRLYPVIARGVSPDPVARRLFWQSRLVMLGLARRLFRRFDEMARAIRSDSAFSAAVDHASRALAEYRQRNETEIYPLYALARRRDPASDAAA